MDDVPQDATPKKRWPRWAKAFLRMLSRVGVVGYAAKKAGVDRTLPYKLRAEDESFRAAWETALDEAIDVAEKEAWRRGVKGCKRPVYQGGECVGFVQEHSDVLLIFMLKANRPDKYREKVAHQHEGGIDHKISGRLAFKIEDAVSADKELEGWHGGPLHERNGTPLANGSP